ncbi:MAG: radical SAM protein [Candidatus Gastranaerophilales bacterium]|nr:radical SAM protein [Candidatus Gastranaerophilales bacterium]
MAIITSPKSELIEFNDLFIEMSKKTCNLKCKHCYIDFSNEKSIKNFLPLETIKECLRDLKGENLKYIHLTGAEPMLHPDFNTILRYCLKYTSTVIHTNGYSINDKKARFLKKVEEENNKNNEIIMKLSLEHYDERTNDEIRGRGSYRKCLHSVQSLLKYGFNPLITVVNHFNEDEKQMRQKLKELFETIGFITEDININIIPLINKKEFAETGEQEMVYKNLDCSFGRTLAINGVYNCLLNTDDYRGRSGSDFKNYSKRAMLDSPACSYCMKSHKQLFGINFTDRE